MVACAPQPYMRPWHCHLAVVRRPAGVSRTAQIARMTKACDWLSCSAGVQRREVVFLRRRGVVGADEGAWGQQSWSRSGGHGSWWL